MREHLLTTEDGTSYFFGLTSASLASIREAEQAEAAMLFDANGQTSIVYAAHFIGNPALPKYSSWGADVVDDEVHVHLSFNTDSWITIGLTTG